MCKRLIKELVFKDENNEIIGRDKDGFYIAKISERDCLTTSKHRITADDVKRIITSWINR